MQPCVPYAVAKWVEQQGDFECNCHHSLCEKFKNRAVVIGRFAAKGSIKRAFFIALKHLWSIAQPENSQKLLMPPD
jgi:hypothetical protein